MNEKIMRLANGVEIPSVGYGTWQAADGETALEGAAAALRLGYRHIDTAAAYGNEASIGRAVRESGIERKDIFVTSKVWNTERGYDKAMAAFEKTMAAIGLDYLDLYLIHWPAVPLKYDNWQELNLGTWRALTEIYKSGRVRAIGVSNFKVSHLAALMETEVRPMVNQIEFHPGQLQTEIRDYCRENDILIEAWSPLGTGRMLSNPTLSAIAAKYGKSAAQLCIRWCIQHQAVPLPKSVTPERIAQNLDVYDFVISDEDMQVIDSMEYFGGSGHDPDTVKF